MKKILLTAVLVLLTACGPSNNVKYQDVATPVYIVPAPPVVTRPALVTDTLTPAQRAQPGVVLQAEQASWAQVMGYIEQLETIVQKYGQLSVESKKNLDAFLAAHPEMKVTAKDLDSASVSEWKKIFESKQDAPPAK